MVDENKIPTLPHTIKRIVKRVGREWSDIRNALLVRGVSRFINRHTRGNPGRAPVVIFNTSTRLSGLSLNAAYSLITGWALRMTGVRVIHFVCNRGMSRCVLGTNKNDLNSPPPCRNCVLQSKRFYFGAETRWFEYADDISLKSQLECLGLDMLQQFEYQGVPLGILVLPSLRWILRRHHLVDDERIRVLYRDFIQSAYRVIQEFKRVLEDENPQAVVVFNGMFFPEAAVRWLAQKNGVRVISHEVGLLPFSAFFTDGEATAYPIHIPQEFQLNGEQENKLDAYLTERLKGRFTMAGIRFWPEMHQLDEKFLERAQKFKQIIPIFTNVVFDTSQSHANVIFTDMFDWLGLVVEVIKAHPETFFVIRAHPDELRPGKESCESVGEWVRRNGVDRLTNVLFVEATEYISSYELIQRSKFIMVYNSTIGLEAAVLGMPVLCGGKARFTQLDTVFFPKTRAEYYQLAEKLLRAKKINVPNEFQKNARRFLFFQLFISSLRFDAYLKQDPWRDGYVILRRIPMKLLRPETSTVLKVIADGILFNRPFTNEL